VSNATWQEDLVISHLALGDALAASGDRAAAIAEYKLALPLEQQLVDRDPTNARQKERLETLKSKL
jgi:predicted negative regulator of RcsB-dependent stress response